MRQPTPITGKSINFGYAPSGTVLGGPALGKNDRGYSSTVQDPEALRARNQSWIDQVATSIGGGAYKGIMTSLELIGYLGDLENNLKQIADLEQIESNWLSDWAAERKKEFDEAYPIYRERSDKIFDLSDPGFYWQGVQSIIDSAVGFGAVGGGAGLALTTAARASRLASLLGTGLTEAGVTGSAAYISNFAESKMMGLELYNNIMDSYEDRILSGEISEADARRIAGEEADKFMLRNKLFIVTDALALHGIFRGGKFVDNLEEGVKTQYKRQAGKTVSWAERNPTLAMLGRDSLGEYFEETGQGILQGEGEYGAARAMGEDLQDFGDSFFERALDTFVSPETQLEGVLGFFGGSAQAALGKLPSRIANKADNQARKDLQMQVISENEKGLTELFGNIAKKTEDRQRAITNNQDILANSIKEEIFNEIALNNFEAGTTSILENQLKDIQSMSQEEATSLGYEDNYREEATNRLNQLTSLRRDYIKIRDRFTEPEFQPRVREIFLTKVQKDNLAKDIMTVRDAIENTKSQLEGKIAQVYELSNNAMQVRVPVLEERIKVLNELEAELIAKKEQESLTPTGRKSKNKRLINKLNKAYEAPLERLRKDRKKTEEEKNEIINQNKELESYYEDVILSDFAEFQDVIELQKLEADVRSAYDVVTDRYRKLSDKKELSKLIEEERGERDEILKEVQKEENARRKASVKKENDEKAINDIQRKKEKEQARKEEEKRKKEENKRGLTSQGPVAQPPITQPPVEQTPPIENPMLDNQQYPDFLEGETVFSAEEFEDSPLPPTAEDTRQEIEERSGSNQEHATEVYPGPQEWTGRTEEVLMETLREDTERDKIVDAASALAYLTKAFEEGRGTTTNELNANLHTLLLSPSISEGTEIEFEIDSNYITYNKLKDDPDRVPIAIKIDGTIVAYLHDIDYITPERVAEWTVIDNKRVDNIELQKTELRKIRQAIVNSPVKIKTRINRKSIGHLSRDVDNNYRDVSEALPQIEQFAIFKNGKFYATESTLTDLPLVNNLDKGQEGVVYALLPTPNGKYMAVPIKNKKIGKRVAASLTNALFIHTQHQTGETTPEHKEIRDRIINELELDIFTHAGLRDYFSLFVYKYDFQTDRDSRLDQSDNLRIAKIKNDSGREQRFFNISGNSVQFIRSGAKFFEIALKPSGSQDAVLRQLQNQERLLNYLEAHLEDMHVNIDLNRMGTTTALNIPIIGTDSEGNFTVDIDSYDNYIGFLKAQTETNIVANELENGEHAYFDQPNIHFDTSFAERSSIELIPPTTSAKEGELIQPEEAESTPDVPEGNPFEEFGIDIIDRGTDESLGNVESNRLERDGILDSILIPGFTAYRQGQAVAVISRALLNQVRDKRLTFGEAFDNIEKSFKRFEKDPRFKELLDNWPTFKNLAYQKLSTLGIVKITRDNEIDSEGFEDMDNDWERTNFDDSWSFSVSSKKNASQRIKEFLAFIPDRDENGTKASYLNTPIYKSYDEVTEKLMGLLTDTPNNFEAMREVLEDNKGQFPWIKSLLLEFDKYPGDKERLKRDFVVTFSKAATQMQMVLWEEKTETIFDPSTMSRRTVVDKDGKPKKYFSIRTISSDQDSIASLITSRWGENLRNSDLVKEVEGDLVMDEESRLELIKEFEEVGKSPDIDRVDNLLRKLGIELSPATLKKLEDGKLGRMSLKNHFSKQSGIFLLMKNRLKGIDAVSSEEDQDLYKYNPLLNNSGIRILAREEANNAASTYSSSYKNINGDTVQGFTLNRGINHIYRKLMNPEYAKSLYQIGFNSNSEIDGNPLYKNWIWRLAHDEKFRNNFSIAPFDGLRRANSTQDGVQLGKMSDKDLEVTSFGLFQNQGGGKDNIARFLLTIPGKTTSFVITAPKHDVKVFFDGDAPIEEAEIGRSTMDALYSIAESEMRRIYRFQNMTTEQRKELPESYRSNASKFFLFPELNTLEGIWRGDTLLVESFDTGEGVTVKQRIEKAIRDIVVREVNEKKATWEKAGVLDGENLKYLDKGYDDTITKKAGKRKIDYAAFDLIINEMLARTGMHQAFIGDPASYAKKTPEATFDNIAKRLARLSAPGLDMAEDASNSFFYSIFINDHEVPSKNIEQIKQRLKDKGVAYENINTSDASEFTTLKERLIMEYGYGKIPTDIYNSIMDKIEKDGGRGEYTLTKEELQTVLDSDKPVYSERILRPDLDMVHDVYIKSASFPLIPELTKGLEIDKLRVEMERIERDKKSSVRVAVRSAVKVGGTSFADVFNPDGTVKEDLNLEPFAVPLPRSGIRIQQELPYDESKLESTRGTQETKLLFEGILDIPGMADLKKKYDSTFKKLFEKGLERLEQDLLDNTGHLNLGRLKQMLLNEAIERNYSYNDIAYLSTIGEDFTIPLWLGASANKYESLLLSLVTNRVIKQKTRGKSYVLVTEAGFKGNSSGIVYTDSYNSETGLLPQRIEIEDGKEVVKPAQILVPWDFRDNNGRILPMDRFVTNGKIDFSKFPKELLESFGYRIPTQKQASMGYTEIVGFIPSIYHNTVIATADWVAQMGSDFDIDKLYTYAYNTYVDKNGNISKLTEDSLKEITEELESYQKKFKEAGVDNDNLNQALDSLEEAIIQKQSDLAQYRDALKEEGLKYDDRKRLIEEAKINIDLFKNNISDLHRWIELRELLERADVEILQNEILDVHKAVVSTPEVHDRMMQPLDFGKLERPDGTGLASDIVSAYQKREGKRNVNFLNSNYWNQKYLESIDGKAGTAIKALDSTFNAVVQQINKEDELYLRTVDMEGKEHPIYIVFGKDSDYSPIKLNNLSNPLTWRGGEKSNVHAAYASAAVDNESNPILGKINSNPITFNVERAMAQVGFEEDHIAYFTSQPAIREYTEALRALEGSTAEFESNAKEKAFIKIESRLLESLRNKLSKEEFERFLEKKDNHNYPLTVKDMKASIASPAYKGKYLHYEQIQIYALHKFLHIDHIGKAIGDVQRAINSDSKGVGKNFFESVDKEEQVKRLSSNGLIANTDKLIGTYNGEDISPSTISGFASVYGVMAANRLYNRSGSKPLFPYADKAISDTFEEIGETTGRILTPDKKREILNSMKGFLFSKSGFNVGLSEERQRLFFDSEDNKSVASRVLEYYGTEEGRKNAFIIRLNPNIDRTGKRPSLLQYTAAKEENIEELEIYQGFIDLMNSYPELGIDLIKYAFLSGGVQGPRNYIKYIPVQYLIENGFADAARELNMNDETVLGSFSNREPGKIGTFTLQYFQHNPIEAKKIKDDLSDITLRRGKRHNILQFETDPIGGKSDNLLVDREVNGEMIRWFPEVVSQYNPAAVKKFNLFRLTGTTPTGGAIYTKIDTLGSDFYNEYNGEIGSDGIQKSLIRGNNSTIELQSNKVPETIKTQNKPITNNSITERFTTLDASLGTIAESNNPAYASIAKFLLSIKDTWKDTTFSVDDTYRSEGAFFTDGEKKHIIINPTRFTEGPYSLQGFERTILHETIHAVTSWAAKNRESETLTPKQRKALANIQNIRDRVLSEIENGNLENRGYYWSELQEFNSLYKDFKDGKTLSLKQRNRMSELKKYYAFSSQRTSDNLHEFITEGLSSAETQELLNSIERTSSTSLLDRFVEMVKDIIQEFGKLFGNSFNENSEMANLIENFIILTDTNLNREDAVPNQASQKKRKGLVSGNRPPEGFVPDQSIGYIDQYRQEKEIEAGFRHESGETKRYLKWEKAREAAIKYNKENRGSDLTAKLTKVLGEKGDNRVYHAVILEPKNVDYSVGRMDRKYVTLIDSIRDRISDINRSISRANEAGNGLRVKELEAQRTSLEKRIESIEDEAILATVFDIAERELQEVRDILDQVSLSPNDLEYANKTLNLWERADNIFATERELEEGGVNIDLLGEIKGRAGTLRSRWNTIAKNNLLSEMRKLDMKAEISDLEATTDISGFTSSFLDISRSGKAVLSAIDLWKRRASFDTNKEATEKIDQIEELTKEVRKTKDFKREGYYTFAQKTKDGKLTGDLVGYISPEFFVERDRKRNLALNSSGRNRAKNWKAYNEWKRQNTTIFDTRKLYERTDDGYVWKNNKEYINELYETVNDTDKVNQELARLREYIEQYNQELLFEKQRVQSLSHPEIELSQWTAENDPKNYLEGILDDNYTSNFISGKFIPNRGYKYSVEVPISKWRDPNYEKIKKDPVLFKFYNYTIDTLNEMFSYLPPEKRRNLHYNTLPSISQSILEQYNQKGVSKAVQGLGDWFLENISSAEEGAMKIDPITQRQVPTLSVSYLNDMSPEEKSYDLGKVLKIFSLSALSYKHKSKVENNIKLAQAVIDTMKEVSLRADGETRKNKFNEDTEIERGLEKLRKQVDYAVKAFYGNRRENEGVIKGEKGKVLTSKDKARKKELEEIINDSSASREKKEEAKKELANLGRNLTLSRIINLMVQYVQVKGMGWNPLAAMINLGQGQSSNMIWANGRTDFDLQDLKRATGLLLNSSLRSISGNTFANDTTRKLEALMKNFDTLKEINESAHSRTDSSNRTAKGMAQLAPFELTRRTEFFNQGQTMVAMMLNKKITNLKGEEKSLWDAYDADGKWRTEEFGEADPDMEFRFASRLTQVIKAIHGNYDPDSPISFKGKSLGQVLMQFRSWIPEGIANRLQGQRYDELLGREVKGRWRTYADLGPVKALKTLFKQLTYNKDAFEGMNDVDIQNMRRNLMELAQVLSLTGFYYIMKGALEGEDDEDRKFFYRFMLNQTSRLQDDLLFYASPSSFEELIRNIVPISSIYMESVAFMDAVVDHMQGDGTYPSGINAGRSKVLWTGARLFPFTGQVRRVVSIGEMVYNEM